MKTRTLTKKTWLIAACALLIAALAFPAGMRAFALNDYMTDAAPIASLAPGNYVYDGQSLSFSTAAGGAQIYYTTDGSVPDNTSTLYSTALTLNAGYHQFRAVAHKNGSYSAVGDYEYYIGEGNLMQGKPFTFNPEADPETDLRNAADGSLLATPESRSFVTSGFWGYNTLSGTANLEYIVFDLGEETVFDYAVWMGFQYDGAHGFGKMEVSATSDFAASTVVWQAAPDQIIGYYDGLAVVNNVTVMAPGGNGYEVFFDTPATGRYLKLSFLTGVSSRRFLAGIQIANFPDTPPKAPANLMQGKSFTFNPEVDPTTDIWNAANGAQLTTPESRAFVTAGAWTFYTMSCASFTYIQFDFNTSATFNYLVWQTYQYDYANAIGKVEAAESADFSDSEIVWQASPSQIIDFYGPAIYNNTDVMAPGNNGYEVFLDTPVTARYLRVSYLAGTGRKFFSGIQVWNYPADTTVPYLLVPDFDDTERLNKATGTAAATVLAELNAVPYNTLTVDDSSGNSHILSVDWTAPQDYDAIYGGIFEFTARVTNIPAGVSNLYDIGRTILVSLPVVTNPTALKLYIAEKDGTSAGSYTSSTFSVFAQTLLDAKAMVADLEGADLEGYTQLQVDNMLAGLQYDFNALIPLGDKTALNAEIIRVGGTAGTTYTATSFAAFTGKLTAAQSAAASGDVSQTQVDTALSELTAAFNGLLPKGNTSALTALIAQADLKTQAGHTPGSWSNFSIALASAKSTAADGDVSQTAADNAVTALQTAMNNLRLAANKTALNSKIADAEALLNNTVYTAASLSDLEEAIDAAKNVRDDDEAIQSEADGAVSDINVMIAALVRLGSRTALLADIAALEANSAKYTAASWTAFGTALTAAKNVANNAQASEAQVAAAESAFASAKAGLVLKGDKTALAALIAADLNEGDYTALSWYTYQTAYNAAVIVNGDDEAVQSVVDAKADALSAAAGGLVKLGDKTALNSKITEADGKLTGNYTESTLAALNAALIEARTVKNDAQATQADVDAALAQLNTAINGLKAAPNGGGCKKAASFSAVLMLALAGLFVFKKRG